MKNVLGSGQEVALRPAALGSLVCKLRRLWEFDGGSLGPPQPGPERKTVLVGR